MQPLLYTPALINSNANKKCKPKAWSISPFSSLQVINIPRPRHLHLHVSRLLTQNRTIHTCTPQLLLTNPSPPKYIIQDLTRTHKSSILNFRPDIQSSLQIFDLCFESGKVFGSFRAARVFLELLREEGENVSNPEDIAVGCVGFPGGFWDGDF